MTADSPMASVRNLSTLGAALLLAACTSLPVPTVQPTTSPPATPPPSPSVAVASASASPRATPSPTEPGGGFGPGGETAANDFNPTVAPCDPFTPANLGPWSIYAASGFSAVVNGSSDVLAESHRVDVGISLNFGPINPQDSVNWATRSGTAVDGADFVGQSGNVTAVQGVGGTAISVELVDDAVAEPTESFFIDLTSATGQYPIGPCRTVEIGIWDNDFLSVDPLPPVFEGSGNSDRVLFVTARFAYPQPYPIDIRASTYPSSSNPAVEDEDYSFDRTSSYGTLRPGELSTSWGIDILGDDEVEPDEAFTFWIRAQNGGDLSFMVIDVTTNVTITDDDEPGATDIELSIGDGSGAEGTGFVSLPLTLSERYYFDLRVDFEVRDGTARLNDGYLITGGSVTIPGGEMSGEIRIPVADDQLDEPDETFTVVISTPGGVIVVRNRATGTILDDDYPPGIVIDQPSASEGAGKVRFVVSLTSASGKAVAVTYRTLDGTAMAGTDYTAQGVSNTVPCPVPPSGSSAYPCTLQFAPGTTAIAIDVPLLNDTTTEPTESFQVRLSNPINATLDVAQGSASITDDDGLVVVQESAASITYRKTWTTQSLAGALGGAVRYASVTRSKASLTFTGRRIEVLSTRGPDRGKVAILLDGVKVATVNLYSATLGPAAVVFTRDFAASGTHTITLKVLGSKDGRSSGARIDLDAFRYLK